MGTTNRDASRVTQLNKSRALYGYYNNVTDNPTLLVAGLVQREQPTNQQNGVLLDRVQGACPCVGDPQRDYIANPFQNPANCSGK
jgi:hypothetical protein